MSLHEDAREKYPHPCQPVL